jgi:hypothetical protein
MLCNWIMVSFIIVVSSKFPDNILLIFQPPYSPRIESNRESMAIHKTRIELGTV